jgi:hypothetical protein
MTDKVEQITGVIGDPKSWRVVEQDGGELVQVEVRPGVRVRMRKAEAIEKGLWKDPEAKSRPPKSNKQRRPGQNKGA